MLTANFLDYKNWMTTREDSLDYIKTILSALTLEENPAVSFGLRYIDRYTFDGPTESSHADLSYAKK